MKKVILSLLTAMLVVTSMGVTAFASDASLNQVDSLGLLVMIVEDTDGNVISHDIIKEVKVRELKDGTRVPINSPRGVITQHNIDVGETMWYTGDGNGHVLNRKQKVLFIANFNKRISYELGYSGAGYTTAVKSGTGSSFSVAITMPADGSYEFYIKNESSNIVTVKSGSIDY